MNQRQRLGYNEVVAKSMITALTKNKWLLIRTLSDWPWQLYLELSG
jgi:hypothetical protein